MNLKKITENKLNGNKDRLKDLQECLEKNVSTDCMHYIQDEIIKSKINIEYYTSLLERFFQ